MCLYWPDKGPQNTDRTIQAALHRAQELSIKRLVVASSRGETALRLVDSGLEIVCVTYQVGFKHAGMDPMPATDRARLEEAGVRLLTTTHLLAGVNRALRFKFEGVYPSEIISTTLRMLGEGVKVCAEIAGMATDAGLTPPGKDVICIAGSGRGADTACLINPTHSQNFFDLKIREIICKPRDW